MADKRNVWTVPLEGGGWGNRLTTPSRRATADWFESGGSRRLDGTLHAACDTTFAARGSSRSSSGPNSHNDQEPRS